MLGFKPVQWILAACLLFITGFFLWWFAMLLLIPFYHFGMKVSRTNEAGNPDYIKGLIVWNSFHKYFLDKDKLFKKLDHIVQNNEIDKIGH